MKKRWNRLILTAFFVPLPAADLFPQSGGGVDSTLTADRIESTIAFLEDSQKVAELTNRLKLLAEARKATNTSKEAEAPAPAKSFFNLFQAGKKAADGWSGGFKETLSELRLLIDRAEKARSEMRSTF